VITYLQDAAIRHQQDMLREAEERHLEREARKGRKAGHRPHVLLSAGNGNFRWSDVRDRAA
jgi:hypothetical protein